VVTETRRGWGESVGVRLEVVGHLELEGIGVDVRHIDTCLEDALS